MLRAAEGSRLDRLVVPPGHRMLQSAPLLRSLWTFMPAVIAPPVSGEGKGRERSNMATSVTSNLCKFVKVKPLVSNQ